MGGSLTAALAGADEAYLTALSNKGLYKRALRELPESGAQVQWQEDQARVIFADGTEVLLQGSIQQYICSCPSRSVCKHLLMAVLAAQQQGGEMEEADAPAPPDFSQISGIAPAALEKLAGKKAYRTAVFAVQTGEGAIVEQASTLTVTLAESGAVVRFLPGAGVEQSTCSCKAAGVCAHRTQAVLQVIRQLSGALPAAFLPEEEEGALTFSTWTVPHIRQFAQEVLCTGLARLPADMPGRFLQMATICHGGRLANLERLCNRLAGQLERFMAGSAAFRRDGFLSDLCALLQLCDALEAGATDKETVGVFREQYRPIPPVELLGLGSLGWHSNGGYTGVTTWFYCPEQQRMLTHTTALPDESAPAVERMYNQGAPWQLPSKLSAICHGHLSLKGGKVSGRGQLSSSEEAVAQVKGATDLDAAALDPVRFSDFDTLLDALWTHSQQEDRDDLTVLLVPARYGAASFDRITQRLSLPVYDGAERRINLEVGYEASTALLLENLTRLEQTDALHGPLLARIYLRGGRMTAFPIAHLGEERCNLSLDRQKQGAQQQKTYFDWGI